MAIPILSPFAQSPDSHLRCVILEATADPDLHRWIYQLAPDGAPQWAPLFLDTPHEALSEQGPALVMSPAPDQWSDYAHALLAQSDAGCILYLDNPQHWRAAVTHCQSLLSVRTEERSDQLMRFFEPRWIEPLLETLSPGERQAFFGPFSGLAWRNELGWRYASRPQPWDGTLQPPGWLWLGQQRRQEMEKVRLRLFAVQMAGDYRSVIESSPAEDFVHQQLMAAHEAGISQKAQYERWLRLVLRRGTEFWKSEPARAVLARQDLATAAKLDELESLSG
ncbi:DUF4123 domain-containing protein [Pseudomonas sp.]|uniref:DUF4123 domain-containing protein n=1 Tax=Pseudomonas sp. TaxID=306 RepID=UPI003D128A22